LESSEVAVNGPGQENHPGVRVEGAAARIGGWLATILLALFGFAMLAGGIMLIGVGGSVYYTVAGILILAATWLRLRDSRWGRPIYAAFLLLTLLWTYWETGGTGWGLLPRLPVPLLFGLLFLPRRLNERLLQRPALTGAVALGLLATCLLTIMLWPETNAPLESKPVGRTAGASWQYFGGDLSGTRYSAATRSHRPMSSASRSLGPIEPVRSTRSARAACRRHRSRSAKRSTSAPASTISWR
jgi:hypothetical protein